MPTVGSQDLTARERFGAGIASVENRPRPAVVAGLLALATAAGPFLARLAVNGRAPAPVTLGNWVPALTTVALVGPALAAGVLLATTDDDLTRVGLAFVTVFGLLGAAAPAVYVPASVAVVGGGGLALGRALERRRAATADWRLLPIALVFAGVAVSLLAGLSVVPEARPVGAHLTMLGAAATPALLGHGRGDWALGGLVAGLLVAAGLSAPFVTAAAALVGGGVVATGLLVMAAGLSGLVTTASAAFRARRWNALWGAGMLLVAGVPGTLPRALAAVLGLLFLVEKGGVTS